MKHEADCFIDKRSFQDVQETSFLSAEDAADFNADGFLILREVLPLDLIAELRAESESLLQGGLWLSAPETKSEKYRMCLYETVVREIVNDINGGPSKVLLAFLLQSAPGDPLFKPWHQDGVYWGGDDARVTASFIPLTPFTEENGPLYVVKGSHRLGRVYHRLEKDQKYRPNSLACDVSGFKEPVLIEAEPGDLVLCHSLTIHAAFPNLSDKVRLNFGCHWHHVDSEIVLDKPTERAYEKNQKI